MRRLIWVGCLVPFISSIVLMVWYWPGSLPQDSSSGVWVALAQDFAKGVFYRPTFDGFGFGGTRYMPLFFVLHGGLIRLALDPVTAGLILTVASLVLLDAATFLTLRELGVEASVALPLALLPHATATVQLLALQVKGDFLAAALNMAGVYLALRALRRPSAAGWLGSLLAFLGAFLTKLTSVAGGVAVWLWLWGGRRGGGGSGLAAGLGALRAGSLDLLGAAVLVIGTEMSGAPARARPVVALTLVLAGLTLVSWVPGMISIPTLIDRGGKPTRATTAALAQRLGPAAQENLLSENPILPVLWGGRPRVLDPFTLRVLARQRPEGGTEFYRRLAGREFGAVVLVDFTGADAAHLPDALRACRASDGARCYGEVLFPAGFLDSLEREYRLSFVERPFVVYEPRAAGR